MVLWCDKELDIKIYQEAYNLSKELNSDTTKSGGNPYPKGTVEFHSWNVGWNTYYNKDWD